MNLRELGYQHGKRLLAEGQWPKPMTEKDNPHVHYSVRKAWNEGVNQAIKEGGERER